MKSDTKILTVVVLTSLALILLANYVTTCNEIVCASVVSKCMLTQSCKCDLKNCSCCKECFSCLSYLYSECCSCVDLCPKPNETRNALSKKSHVEELEGVPGLFSALTEDNDPEDRWTVFTFPEDLDAVLYGAKMKKDFNYITQSADQELDAKVKERNNDNILTVNCTVAYQSQCMSLNKCKESCSTMGASYYRWFHDGCCECISSTCLHYGINDSRCLYCPENKEDSDEDAPNPEDLDYGEGMGPLDAHSVESNI